MGRLAGKTALITGAAKGLGAAIAQRFADEGATVIVNDLDAGDAQATAHKIGGHAAVADVANSASVVSMFSEISRLSPRLDILVNNAGISGVEPRDVEEVLEKRKKQAEELATTGKISTFIDRTVSVTDAMATDAGGSRRWKFLLLSRSIEIDEYANGRIDHQHRERGRNIRQGPRTVRDS
jgi:NAD(P)-dependent dehydrogenase (short-subunit alcohol dehydrogenase family)